MWIVWCALARHWHRLWQWGSSLWHLHWQSSPALSPLALLLFVRYDRRSHSSVRAQKLPIALIDVQITLFNLHFFKYCLPKILVVSHWLYTICLLSSRSVLAWIIDLPLILDIIIANRSAIRTTMLTINAIPSNSYWLLSNPSPLPNLRICILYAFS